MAFLRLDWVSFAFDAAVNQVISKQRCMQASNKGHIRHGQRKECYKLGPVWSEDIFRDQGLVHARVLVLAEVRAVFCGDVSCHRCCGCCVLCVLSTDLLEGGLPQSCGFLERFLARKEVTE